MSGIFVTGTDTDVGKTHIALGLMAALQNHGLRVAAMKPVSAGCTLTGNGRDAYLQNDDALQLSAQASIAIPYQTLNPYAFAPAIAPHIAAEAIGVTMQLDVLMKAYAEIEPQADVVVVEGAGGWLVPVNATQTLGDCAAALKLPVVLVVGLRLGCINHALLTVQAIHAHGLRLAGWVANDITQDSEYMDENVESLLARIDAPLLGRVPFVPQGRAQDTAKHLNVAALIDACLISK